MIRDRLDTEKLAGFLKKWWATLLLLPFVLMSIHQIWQAFTTHILMLVYYDYVFPYNIVYFLIFHFDLIVHEAGHTFFAIFGNRFIYILGGSIYQLFLPLVLIVFCWYNRYRVGTQLSMAYLGFGWMSVAGYAADAAGRQLPLIGNLGKEAHDWHNIFMHLGLLDSYRGIAIAFALIGGLWYLAALLLPYFWEEYEEVQLEIEV